MKLLVTIPALNEENTIAQVIAGVPRKIPGVREVEVIVVNDGSTDRTAERAAEAGAIVVTLHNRPGLGKVFGTGLERAMRRGADIIVNIDGDGQFDPGDIAKLVHPIIEGKPTAVTALSPTPPSGLTCPWSSTTAAGCRSIINWVCGGTNFTDVSCGFRALIARPRIASRSSADSPTRRNASSVSSAKGCMAEVR
jgi:glycosyltransferase involved in cell wall biosynthesis